MARLGIDLRCVIPLGIFLAGCGAVEPPVARIAPEDPLSAALVELTGDLQALGLRAHASERRFLLPGESFAQPVSVPSGSCRTWTVLASPGLRDVDATLYTPNGDALAQDVESDAHPTIQICSDRSARLFVHLSAYEGAGELVFAEFESSRAIDVTSVVGGRPVVAELGDRQEPELLAALRRRRFRQSGSVREIELPIVAGEARAEVLAPMRVLRGRCYSAVATSPLGVSLEVRRGEILLAREGEAPVTAAQWCSVESGPVDVALSGASGARIRLWIFDAEEARVGGESGLWLGQRP